MGGTHKNRIVRGAGVLWEELGRGIVEGIVGGGGSKEEGGEERGVREPHVIKSRELWDDQGIV